MTEIAGPFSDMLAPAHSVTAIPEGRQPHVMASLWLERYSELLSKAMFRRSTAHRGVQLFGLDLLQGGLGAGSN